MNIACPACRRTLPPTLPPAAAPTAVVDREQVCPSCGARLELTVFPALGRGLAAGRAAEALLAGSEASCFNHPHKRAVVACERCGRFLCGLCEVQIGERHYCPACLSAGRGDLELPQLDAERLCWDRLALALAIYPAFTFWIPIVTAPMVIVLTLRHWRTPGSLVRRGRPRLAIALAVALLELGGLTVMLFFVVAAIAAGS